MHRGPRGNEKEEGNHSQLHMTEVAPTEDVVIKVASVCGEGYTRCFSCAINYINVFIEGRQIVEEQNFELHTVFAKD